MDSITHAIVAVACFHVSFHGHALVACVLGAVLSDIDVFLHAVAERNPHLFLFTHGGFTHTVPGVLVVAAGISAGFSAFAAATGQPGLIPEIPAVVFVPALAGALTHVSLDALALPGIPLLYPLSERKVTAGIFPGPSILLLSTSAAYLALSLSVPGASRWLPAYAGFVALVILARGVLRAVAVHRFGKGAIPTFDPLQWLIVEDAGDSFRVSTARLFSGPTTEKVYAKGTGDLPGNAPAPLPDPEVRRFLYNSYIVVAEKQEGGTLFRDPLREDGFVFYPPRHTRVLIRREGGGKH
ncbi:MAG: metal-dependent hydrolase [Methanolinea sp.]|nr:metal-dependent hydrolase [Methanolinea sp.]